MKSCANLVFAVVLFSVASYPVRAQVQTETEGQQSCRKFVQAFYDWYAPKAAADHAEPSPDSALRDKPTAFSSELSRGLKEDSDAQRKVPDDIVGLDFDPFLGAQDICAPYSLKRITRTGSKCWVEVYGSSCQKQAKPDVVPELEFKDGHWFFVNFHYPAFGKDSDLLTILKDLRKERNKGQAK